ncbi:MAG TPA: Hint domain-containing protein, partial [Bradyrhizobium sp.]
MISGGTAISATVDANGSATVFAGGTASEITINGGTLDVKSGGGAPDAISFTGAGGALELDAAPAHGGAIIGVTATIDGFAVNGDTIDLAGLAYVSGGTATLLPGNSLQITEGSNTANLRFDGGQDFSNNTFLLNPDSSGGTVLTLGSTLPSVGTFAYFVNGSETAGSENSLMRVEQMPNGSWSAPVAITIDGAAAINDVDPSVVALPNGQYLMMYDTFVANALTDTNHLYTAISSDGVNFSDPQMVVQNTSGAFADPTLIQLGDGSFLMAVTAFPGGGGSPAVDLYTSPDGRSYTPTGVSLLGLTSPQLELQPNGDLVLFSNGGNGQNGIISEISTDGGQTWSPQPGVSLAGDYTNPTVLQNAPGQWEMIVDSPISGSPPNGGPSDQQFSLATSTDGLNFTVTQPDFLQQASVPSLVTDPPFIIVANGETSVTSASPDGYLVGAGGLLSVESGGSIANPTIAYDGELAVNSGGTVSGAIDFTTTSGTLEINGPFNPGPLLPDAIISGFVPGDTIGLFGVAADAHADMDYSTNVLTVTDGGNQYQLDFSTSDNFAGEYFHVVAWGKVTDLVLDSMPCYCPGTLILTPQGERCVEELRIGDEVIVKSGIARAIKWIGRRSYNGRFLIGRKDILPICIKAGALDADLPRRDLWISPHHAMYFENEAGSGLMIEAMDLVNGVSIVQAERVEKLEYVHVELETHDVIVAERALSETFLDDDSRAMFNNAAEYHVMYPDHAMQPAHYCAPRLNAGYEVEVVRRRLAERAGRVYRNHDAGVMRGYVDLLGAERIVGWAQNLDYPEAPVCLDIYINDRLMGQVLANTYREDLKRAGIGSGRHGFVFTP